MPEGSLGPSLPIKGTAKTLIRLGAVNLGGFVVLHSFSDTKRTTLLLENVPDDFHTASEKFDPSHEIMALFVLRKFILQTRMRNHPVGLDV